MNLLFYHEYYIYPFILKLIFSPKLLVEKITNESPDYSRIQWLLVPTTMSINFPVYPTSRRMAVHWPPSFVYPTSRRMAVHWPPSLANSFCKPNGTRNFCLKINKSNIIICAKNKLSYFTPIYGRVNIFGGFPFK